MRERGDAECCWIDPCRLSMAIGTEGARKITTLSSNRVTHLHINAWLLDASSHIDVSTVALLQVTHAGHETILSFGLTRSTLLPSVRQLRYAACSVGACG